MGLLVRDTIRLVPVTAGNLRELYDMCNDREVAGEYGGFPPVRWKNSKINL